MSTTDEDRQRLLSPEEIAAMGDNDYDPDEDNAAALDALGVGDLEEDDADAGEGDVADDKPTDAAPAPKPDDAAAPAAAPAVDDQPGDTAVAPAPAPAPHQSTNYSVKLPEDYDDQVKANRAAMAEVRKRFDDGAMDAAERDAALDDLQDKRDELRDIKTRATVSAEMSEQNERNAWVNTINSFVAEAGTKPELGIVDYKKDAAKQADLDTFVKALAAVKGNETKPMRWFLEEAHKRVVALHGIPTTKKPADTSRKPDASAVVQNLADVPGGAGDEDPSSTEFAELDKLTGLAYEKALAALPEAKRDRYMRAA